MAKAEMDAAASAAIEGAAESETAKNEAVANAAGADAEQKTTQAALTAVAAAEGAIALAKTEAAEAIQNAGEKVAETKGDVEWLKSHARATEDSFQNLSKEQMELKSAVLSIAETQAQIQQGLSKLLTPPPSPQEPGLEQQIVNPVEQNPKVGGAATGASADAKKSPSRKSRLWTTGRRG